MYSLINDAKHRNKHNTEVNEMVDIYEDVFGDGFQKVKTITEGTERKINAVQQSYDMGEIGQNEYIKRCADVYFPSNAIGIGGGIIRERNSP